MATAKDKSIELLRDLTAQADEWLKDAYPYRYRNVWADRARRHYVG
jgi:hypothetical protein